MAQFGQSTVFGQPSTDPAMNMHYYSQAQSFAANNPTNLQAQRQLAFWAEVVQRQAAAAQAQHYAQAIAGQAPIQAQPPMPTAAPQSMQQPTLTTVPAGQAPFGQMPFPYVLRH